MSKSEHLKSCEGEGMSTIDNEKKSTSVGLYISGMSIPQVAEILSIPRSTVRSRLKSAGVLRSREEGLKKAAEDGRLGSGMRGKTRIFTESHKEAIRQSRLTWSKGNAMGVRTTSSGYLEITKGENKGKLVHVVKMEKRLGRPLRPDECVHHIDGDKQHNEDNNLALLTKSGHSRLHRREEKLQGKQRERNKNGTWS